MYYVRNNVEYRIASCKKIEQFKAAQAFLLTEIISGKHTFAECSREMLYLLYENMFKWVLFMERFLIDNSMQIDLRVAKLSVDELEAKYETVAQIVRFNPGVFPPLFTKAFLESSFFTFDFLKYSLTAPVETECHSIEYFSLCVDSLLLFLNSVLFVLHEVDTLCFHTPSVPFVCVDDTHFYSEVVTNMFPAVERFRIYQRLFKLDNHVRVKMYVKNTNPEFNNRVAALFRKEGIEVVEIT